MSLDVSIRITGTEQIDELFRKLPETAANRLQAVMVRNQLDHRAEVVRSSTFSPEGNRRLRFALRVFPSERVERKRIDEVEAGTVSFWRGIEIERPEEGVAARLEKQIGPATVGPTRKRYLLIPWGDFTTPSGRPRRERRDIHGISVMAPVLIRDLPGTRVVLGRDGRRRIVQRINEGERARFEGGIRGIRSKKLGTRERVVGILVRQARVVRGLDFFGSWERLEQARTERYNRMLEALVK